jgi:response regulator RpfG family c-di-GMP phosphodiesterase
MTNKNPAALRLAEDIATEAVLEIRLLHEVNAELLQALKKITLVQNENPVIMYQAMEDIARAAIAKAEVTK